MIFWKTQMANNIFNQEVTIPYELPDGWKWDKVSSVADIYTGNSINEEVKAKKYEGKKDCLLFIATKDVDFDNSINYETNVRIPENEEFKTAPANTPLLCVEGGSAGRKLGFVNQTVCFGNKLCAFNANNADAKWIYYILQSSLFQKQFDSLKHGLIGGVSTKLEIML